MKSNILAFLFFFSVSLHAQVNYSIFPGKTINFDVALNQANESKIFVVNSGSNPLVMHWSRVYVNLPSDWVFASCDFGACYGGIPLGPTTMDSIPVGGQGFVGLDIEPGSSPGAGIVQVYVYQEGYPFLGDTLTWMVSATVGINERTAFEQLSVYPNPVKDVMHIEFGSEVGGTVSAVVVDYVGRVVRVLTLNNPVSNVDMSDLKTGSYLLVLKSGNRVARKSFIKTE